MEDQYGGMADLRQYLSSSNSSSRPLYPPIIPPQDLLSSHRGLAPHPYVDMLVFRHDPKTSAAAPTSNNTGGGGLMEASGGLIINGDGTGTGRWPRQETLTLLEIRSRLDPKFKEANQKGPLWDEVSRIMSEEHGYQRSGKKCREKFENLYKYYKKTKEGKAGRQDGKHYRFFRQLEALYGETNSNTNAVSLISESHVDFRYNFANKNPSSLAPNQDNFQCPKLSDTSLSLSNYSDYETSDSTDDSDLNEGLDSSDLKEKKRRGRKRWKVKIRDFIDAQMKKLMDKQEAWMDKMVRTIEHKERERMIREEEWRKQDAARIEREHKFWASERAWIEARDAALMDALHKITSKETTVSPPMAVEISENQNDDGSETMTNSGKGDIWPEDEINRLIQLRTAMEVKFRTRTSVSDEAVLWEEISNKMTCFGHERSALVCKEKWDSVNNYLLKCNKKIRKESSSKGCTYYQNHDQTATISYCGTSDQQPRVDVDHHHNNNNHTIMRLNDHGNSSPNHNDNNSNNAGNNNSISDNCFRYFMGDAYGRIID